MSNVPQDVIDDAVAAGLLDENEHIKPMWFKPWSEAIVKFLQLRAQRSNAEPVYSNTNHGVTMQERHFSYSGDGWIQDNNFDYDAGWRVTGDFIDDNKDKYCQMICDVLNAYTAPPDAGFAAGMRKAAEICEHSAGLWSNLPPHESQRLANFLSRQILSAIPAESKAALREVCMQVAFHSVKFGAMHGSGINMNGLDSDDLEAIVNSVLEGKS